MPERVLDLAMPVIPEHLPPAADGSLRPPLPPARHHLSVSNVKGQHHRRTASRRRGEHPHLRELIGDVQQTVAKPRWTDINRPSGTGIRLTYSAPKASR
jgi:hypothetical protein